MNADSKNYHRIIRRDVMFTPTQTTRTLHIWLPEGYDTCDERYPVMYFFDGHNLFLDEDATYGKSWGLLDFLYGWEKPMIVVGIECSHVGNDRLKEYCPYHICNDFFGDLHGTGAETCRWIVEELKPMIDWEYRTYSFREATGIAGSSMGGLMSLYAVLAHNAVFSKAACLSSSVGPCMQDLLREIYEGQLDGDTRIWLSWGTREGGPQTEANHHALQEALQSRLQITRLYRQPGGRHCEADWEKQVPAFMDFLWLDR